MFVKNLKDCKEFTANDGCHLRELLHPKNDPVALPYSIAIGVVPAGERTFEHKLEQEEVYFILAGAGHMHIDGEMEAVVAQDVIHVPAAAEQWLENTGDTPLRFMAIVSPPWTTAGDMRTE